LELNWRALAEEKRKEVVAARGAYEALLRAEIEHAQAAGVLRSNVSASLLTLLLLNLMNWTIFWFRPDGELTVDELVGHVLDLATQGARTPS
jgi:hypothetical protein